MFDRRHLHCASNPILDSKLRAAIYPAQALTDRQQAEQTAPIARTRAALRRARRGELVIVYILSAWALLTMLPAVIAVVGGWAAVVTWWHLRARFWQIRPDRALLLAHILQGAQLSVRIMLAVGRSALQPRARLMHDAEQHIRARVRRRIGSISRRTAYLSRVTEAKHWRPSPYACDAKHASSAR
jgi:hypothetical protein